MANTISKSSFVRGTNCHKSLYLHLNNPDLKDTVSASQQHIFDMGYEVGEAAQHCFPGGIDASRGNPHEVQEALTFTRELIASGQKVIYEAAFSDGETLCYMDILVNNDGRWQAYEVKASTSPKEYHYTDISFQYYVIRASGLDLAEISLMHLNTKYVRRGELDVKQLFTTINLTDLAQQKQHEIHQNLQALQQMLAQDTTPKIETGHQCTHPYTCDFYGFCHQEEVTDIFSGLKSVKRSKIELLREAEVSSLDEIPPGIRFTNKEWIILQGLFKDEVNRNRPALEAFVRQLQYPLYFIDFESMQLPVPRYDESRSYQQLTFQYSLHIVNKPGDEPIHKEYLGTPPEDPRPDFIRNMLDQLGTSGSILIYNRAFEPPRVRELARDFPAFEKPLQALLPRFVDLMVPFRSLHLYTPAMRGSYSIKAVLPALVPHLSYDALGIQDGGTASLTYLSLFNDSDPMLIQQKRNDLLEYCKLDSLAMVELLKQIS
ncbi:MAG: DUF2779 domain-containing protein [Bacteroidales bacterium]|nr:DUF2779 domain-containing protein [Bacteroidales bacterium]